MPKLSVIDLIWFKPKPETKENTRLIITDSGVCHIINNCLEIKDFILMDRTSKITSKTIETIINTEIKPKIEYNFKFCDKFNGRLRNHIKSIKKICQRI
jgi:hypothetical protein